MSDRVAAVVVAAGRGLRAGGDLPKQYRRLAGQPVIFPSLSMLARHPAISAVQPVIHADDRRL
ncbi:MAG TPA: 2-C-methyl-D-erythritol 4-phosphate cytidylyltransferase, partial [Hyphomicrobiaceae bacterium]|nr:2-C-methyl-D-erythritol 4-phosphate cytidylyltransferase [Hyphomicrobiaceae bacterium]